MSTWMSLGVWLRALVMAVVALAPMARQRLTGESLACALPDLALDVDGDGRADRVRWVRYGDDYWLDVALATGDPAGGFALESTTRVAAASEGGWTLGAADVDGDGRADVIVRDGHGHATTYFSDGRGFVQVPVARSTTE